MHDIVSIFCPRCGAEGAAETRFCRRCGTNLQAIDQVLSGSGSQPESATSQAEHPLKQLRRDILWLAVRGIVTLLIGLPFTLLMILTTIRGGGIISLILTLILATFVVLGARDLLKAYIAFKDPFAALARVNAKRGEQREDVSRGLIESPVEGMGNTPYATSALPSVTEHTTLELNESREHARRGSCQ
jgi:hypothetical protein